jgi:subtilisin family serine protease
VDQPRPVSPFALAWDGQATGRPVRIGILDTGIVRHPWWSDESWFAQVAADDLEEIDRNPEDSRRDRQAGHGTFVAGMVVQNAPGVDLLVERVLRSDGLCDEAELLAVLHRIAALATNGGQPVDVVNLSFGGYTYDDQPSPLVAAAVAAVAARSVVVAAAGNHGSDRPFWPAALPDVIAVGALTADGTERAAFSNFGPWVDTYRRGVGLRSAFVTFPIDVSAPSAPGESNAGGPTLTGDPIFAGYARWSGTSFAAPAVAAEVARAVASGADPRDTVAAIREDRVADGRPIP